MSKTKKRYLKNKRRNEHRENVKNAMDTHHLCYQRRSWTGIAKTLRSHWYCTIDIPRDTLHREIHHRVSHVPVPKTTSIREALEGLRYLEKYHAIKEDDPVEKRLRVLIALFDCIEQPTADAFRTQLEVVHKYNKKPPG